MNARLSSWMAESALDCKGKSAHDIISMLPNTNCLEHSGEAYTMKSWISIAVMGFILLTASNAFAEGSLEKRLMKMGWVKLTMKELQALTNFTASDDFGWAEYIDPTGSMFVTRYLNGSIEKGSREITADGRYCYLYWGAPTTICRSLWKRGKYYAHVRSYGFGASRRHVVKVQITIKPGNTEKL